MTPPAGVRRGSLGWCIAGAGKRRPAIVLHVLNDEMVVIYGTSVGGRDIRHVCLEPRTITGRALGLSHPTYLHVTQIKRVHISEFTLLAGRCVPKVQLALEEALLEAMRDPSSKRPPHSLVALTDAGALEYLPEQAATGVRKP